jgi:hypothetical protein
MRPVAFPLLANYKVHDRHLHEILGGSLGIGNFDPM